ncbi:hypothetical protein [Zunongwangia endophytica]|uniref:Uncharacterized protein n=1 Tax=Zunongwangia endophytica TaxID=1808945 RepID=A0ABV8HDK4_9FLAO|nr:hypothetical protein [Zunongwangia endophytica]MDN3593318.1 hypothetical protein [Zunongwangia endophytica]MDN3596938.1 hypothetical protein [Zunongwangia endophytica]MDN3596998.1 hypothetical protein [Zunongwangia endophytica]
MEQSSQYSFYFENDISKKELQNRVKLFNQFYRDSVIIKISEISYLNGQLDSYTISRKFPDETNFKIGATLENQAYKDKRPNLLSFKNQKIILRTSSNFRFELSKDLNAGIYKTEDK